MVQHFPSLANYIPPQEQLVHNAGVAAKSAAGFLVTIASRMTAGTATFVLNLFVMVYAMFFFLKDGKQIMATILHYIPLAAQDKRRMVQQFTSITRATVKGTLLIGIIQGALDGVAFWLAGIDGSAFWGTLMAIFNSSGSWGASRVGTCGSVSVAERSRRCRAGRYELVCCGFGSCRICRAPRSRRQRYQNA